MNLRTAKQIRKAVSYRPDQLAQYEKVELHHIAHMPVFQKHTRIVRSWDPQVKKIVSRAVEKIRYGQDGKTPLKPIWATVKDPETGIEHTIPQTEFIPVTKPIRLKKGSPKAVYRLLKKLEQTVGLDQVYAQLAAETGAPV